MHIVWKVCERQHVFDLRSHAVDPQSGMPASLTGGMVDASWAPLEVPPLEDEPLPVLPPLLLVLLPLEEPSDDDPLPPELEPLNPLLLPLELLQPVDAVPEKAARPRKGEARQTMMVWRVRLRGGIYDSSSLNLTPRLLASKRITALVDEPRTMLDVDPFDSTPAFGGSSRRAPRGRSPRGG